MLADIDDPPRSRTGGMVLGALVALPIAAIFVSWFLPVLLQSVLGGSKKLDDRLEMEKAYMDAVCTQAIVLPRDESLCECVLATEYPAHDCQAPFLAWSVARQQQHCSAPKAHEESLSFCTCVETVAENMVAAPDEDAAEKAAQNYRNCQTLPDAVYLPSIEALAASE